MTEDELRRLADDAAFLHERLAGGWIPDDTPANRQMAQSRLERWCQLSAGGDWPTFTRRLAWDGLDVDTALPLLCDGHLEDRHGLPAWAEFLAEVLRDAPDDLPDDLEGLETEYFVEPFVATAQARLTGLGAGDPLWLSRAAQESLCRHLTDSLHALFRPTLGYEMSQRAARLALLAKRPALRAGKQPHNRLHLAALCRNYPVLARQLCEAALHWMEGIQEFKTRLAADWPALTSRAGAPDSPETSRVIDLRAGLSDPHSSGHTVWRVTLAGGVSVAYKPKALELDRAWNDLLLWCNARGLTPSLRALWSLPRDGYGWMEWAESSATTEQPLLYRRVGVLLGLLHLLHATDIHGENLILAGAQPLLIDAEMLLYPQVRGQAADDPLDVLRTGLLPRWIVGREGVAEIGGVPGVAAAAHREEIVAGYESLCHFVDSHWDALSAADGPLAAIRRGAVRFAPRPTAAYTRLLEHLRHPAFLQRGSDFSIEADRLAHSYSRTEERATFRPLLSEEHAAIAQGDVPFFTAPVGGQVVADSPASLALPLHWPSFARPTLAVQAQQAQLVRASLDRSAYLPSAAGGDISFLAWAICLGEALAQRAVSLKGGGVGWLAAQFQPKSGLHQHGLLGDDLYAGRAGIALFLAGLYRVTGEERWRNLALSALRRERPDHRLPDGGGQLYALALCSHLLWGSDSGNRPDRQGDLGDLVADSRNRQRVWGVLDGQAGVVLGLLALHEQTANAAFLERAVDCGDRLLAGAEEWQNSETALGGFSHGAAGIGYALTRLYSASEEERFLDGAARGWAFQRSLYNGEAGNWQDRRGATPVYLDNWCNGAAGIGLAAVGSLDVLPELVDVAERTGALLTTAQPPFLDTLCCGGFGQIECLLEMGLRLNRPAWVAQATAQAQAALSRASSAGSFALYDELPTHLFNPAFYRGVAGIGYTLLRLAGVNGETTAQLPCVLNWWVE